MKLGLSGEEIFCGLLGLGQTPEVEFVKDGFLASSFLQRSYGGIGLLLGTCRKVYLRVVL